MSKKINYSTWLKIRSGKSLWDLCEEGKSIKEIMTFASEHGISIPKEYVSNYKKYYKKQKENNGEEEKKEGKENTEKENRKNSQRDTEKAELSDIDLYTKLSKILDKLIDFGATKIDSGEIFISASDLIRAIELRKELGEENSDIQETLDKILAGK